jgi:hypothetical protein
MKLTICLITKGREEYFSSLARGIEECLLYPGVNLLVIDNGSNSIMKEKIQKWAKSLGRTELVRLEKNVTSPAEIWQEIYKRDIDWAIFPSDDDVLEPQIINEWHETVNAHPMLIAFATSLSLIDENGLKTGEVFSPSCMEKVGAARVAAAFHEPPFLWPGLFFRVSQLPRDLPSSRYVFDWWVGIHLLISGKVEYSESIGVNYRVHDDQESNLVNSRRKYFEALIYLDQIVASKEFIVWLSNVSYLEKISFWESLIASPPIYSDTSFSNVILTSIYRKTVESCDLVHEKVEFANSFALKNGVLLRNGQVGAILSRVANSNHVLPGNVNATAAKDACDDIKKLASLVSSPSARYSRQLGCSHSGEKFDVFNLDCDSLKKIQLESAADELIKMLSQEYEREVLKAQILTSGEVYVLHILRKIRHVAPKFIRRRLRLLRLKHR